MISQQRQRRVPSPRTSETNHNERHYPHDAGGQPLPPSKAQSLLMRQQLSIPSITKHKKKRHLLPTVAITMCLTAIAVYVTIVEVNERGRTPLLSMSEHDLTNLPHPTEINTERIAPSDINYLRKSEDEKRTRDAPNNLEKDSSHHHYHQSFDFSTSLRLLQQRYTAFVEKGKRQQETKPGQLQKRLVSFFKPSVAEKDDDHDLTLVTHISADNFDRVMTLYEWWRGPMSVAIYCTPHIDMEAFWNNLREAQPHAKSSFHRTFWERHANLHFFLEYNKDEYPHNILRNMAAQHATGSYVFLVDADFLPSPPRTHWFLKERVLSPEMYDRMRLEKHAFVFPLFELYPDSDKKHKNQGSRGNTTKIEYLTEGAGLSKDVPKTIAELIDMYDKNIARQWHFQAGHDATNYEKWFGLQKKETENRPVAYPIVPTPRYEPYILVYRPHIPKYWEAFRGYGLDKRSFLNECFFAGIRFHVLLDVFVTHTAHPSHRNTNQLKVNRKIWYDSFAPYIRSKYNGTTDAKTMDSFLNLPVF